MIEAYSWKKFQVDEFFNIEKVPSYNKEHLNLNSDVQDYDYITRTALNRGIYCTTGFIANSGLNMAGTYSLGLLQMNFFYRDRPWYAGQFVRSIVPRFQLPLKTGLYFETIFNHLSDYLSSSLIRDIDAKFLSSSITLPVSSDGVLDFDYMEDFISEIINAYIPQKGKLCSAEQDQYLMAAGINNIDLTILDKDILAKMTDGREKFREFSIIKLFNAETGDVDLHESDIDGQGEYFINSGSQNLGIKGKTSRKSKIFPPNTITMDFWGNAFYRSSPYKLATHNHVFSLSGDCIKNEQVGMFIAISLSKLSGLYSFDNMLTWNLLKKKSLLLPCDCNDNIDFDYMEKYINVIKKMVINNINDQRANEILYAGKIIDRIN